MDLDNPPKVYVPAVPTIGINPNYPEQLELLEFVTHARLSLVRCLTKYGFSVPHPLGQDTYIKTLGGQIAAADAVIFPAMKGTLPHELAKRVGAQRFSEFYSFITSAHVGDRSVYNADETSIPCVGIDTDGLYRKAVDILWGFKRKGAFSSDPDSIVHIISPSEGDTLDDLNKKAVELLAELAEQKFGKLRTAIKKEWTGSEEDFRSFRKSLPEGIKRSEFGVIGFGSATMQDQWLLEAGHEFGFELARRGLRLITGAGKAGFMGAAAEGFFDGVPIFHLNNPNALFHPAHIGISLKEILLLEGPPVLKEFKHRTDLSADEIEKYSILDQLLVLNTRYERLDAFFKGYPGDDTKRVSKTAKVACVFPGGIGTLEELTTMIQMKMYDEEKGREARESGLEYTPKYNFEVHLINIHDYYKDLIDLCKEVGINHLFKVYNSVEESMHRTDVLKTEFEKQQEASCPPKHLILPSRVDESLGRIATKEAAKRLILPSSF